MAKLAIKGGKPIRTQVFPAYNTIGAEEEQAVLKVLRSGQLSKYLGCWHKDFYGGNEVQALEEEWADFFGVKYAFAVNSCTSGLIAAMGAIGISPGDEVLVTPTSMAISANAPIFYGGIPVFIDIEENFYCIDPQKIEEKITDKTKAIIAVDLFGHSYNKTIINKIAKKHNLYVIEDAAQAIGGMSGDQKAGTLGDIGVYSLNYHKHIHSGEGGIVVTNDATLAEKISLIRNHAESVVEGKGVSELTNMLGYNFRMTEIEAAIARCQLKKVNSFIERRLVGVDYLRDRITKIPCISGGHSDKEVKHAYYGLPFNFDKSIANVSREAFINAVRAELPGCELREEEGPLIGCGYVKPIYLQPMFQKRIAIGKDGYPFSLSNIVYDQGLCPVAESVHREKIIHTSMIGHHLTTEDLNDVANAFEKVWENINEI